MSFETKDKVKTMDGYYQELIDKIEANYVKLQIEVTNNFGEQEISNKSYNASCVEHNKQLILHKMQIHFHGE